MAPLQPELLSEIARSAGALPIAAQKRLLAEVSTLQRQVGALLDALSERSPTLPSSHRPPSPPTDVEPLPAATFYGTFLGPFALYRGTTRVPLGHNKAVLELCRYLIARAAQAVPRDEIIDLLWPEADPDRAVHRLHVTISSLRRMLGGSKARDCYVQFGNDSYSIAAGLVTTDCDLFEHHYGHGTLCLRKNDEGAAAAAFRAALALYHGDYLAEHPYTEWTLQYRVHFRELRLNALTFLCQQAMLADNPTVVVNYAQELLTIDNLREFPHRSLMRAHYVMGQRGCAIRQYLTCAEDLRRELGVAPSTETQLLYRAICDDEDLPPERHIRW